MELECYPIKIFRVRSRSTKRVFFFAVPSGCGVSNRELENSGIDRIAAA